MNYYLHSFSDGFMVLGAMMATVFLMWLLAHIFVIFIRAKEDALKNPINYKTFFVFLGGIWKHTILVFRKPSPETNTNDRE